MTDEPGAPNRAGGGQDAAAPPGTTNSRIEVRLWRLARGADRAEARMCTKFGRRDFRVYINGELLWSRNYVIDERERFDADARARREEFLANGWAEPAGPV
jgi:hypothetical protein